MTTAARVPDLSFHDGHTIPQLGYGVWQVADDIAADMVAHAIRSGYRHVDTAAIYANEVGVGQGVRASGVPREEVFVTTKLWNDAHGSVESVDGALVASLDRLGFTSIDLYLMHWPCPARGLHVATWQALVELHGRGDGRIGSIGVCNFQEHHLADVIEATGVAPVINQVELHPYFQQRELRVAHARTGVVTQSWSPLGQGGELLADPVIVDIADAHGVSPAQVVIRWHLQHGLVVIPKSQTPARIESNVDVFGFELTDAQLAAIDGLDRGPEGRIGPNPDTATF